MRTIQLAHPAALHAKLRSEGCDLLPGPLGHPCARLEREPVRPRWLPRGMERPPSEVEEEEHGLAAPLADGANLVRAAGTRSAGTTAHGQREQYWLYRRRTATLAGADTL